MDKFNIELLRRSLKSGVTAFLLEFFLMLKDKFIGPSYNVFELRREDFTVEHSGLHAMVKISTCTDWNDVSNKNKQVIIDKLNDQYWGKIEWFKLGWRFWYGAIDEILCIISWTREVGKCEDFFFPVSSNCAIIYQTLTLNEFRGNGIAVILYKQICYELFEKGYARVYAFCRKSNYASKKTIEKSGFKYIGKGIVIKMCKKSIWFPVIKSFTEG